MEEIWENYENVILEGINRYVPHKTVSKNPDPEYYNKEVKWLKVKVRKMYNRRKLGELYLAQLRPLSKELLVAKKTAKEKCLRSVLQNDGRCWAEFCKYVRRHKGNRESILAIKDNKGKLVTDPIGKANALNNYYASLFGRESINPQIQQKLVYPLRPVLTL